MSLSMSPAWRGAAAGALIALALGVASGPAQALHQRIYPLKEVLADSEFVAMGRCVAVDIPRMRAALILDEALKGKLPCRWVALNVAPGGWGHPQPMIRRLGAGLPLLFFGSRARGRHVLVGFTQGTWFQITAPEGKDAERLAWSFTHCEVYLRRTFDGGTAELSQVVRDVLAGKRESPAPDIGRGGGMGPEFDPSFTPERPLPALPDHVARALEQPRSGGRVRQVAVRPLSTEERVWVVAAAARYRHPEDECSQLLAQAGYRSSDAERALELEQQYGSGGNRAWVRSAEEILELKLRSDRLSWQDVRGVLMRAGELFTPISDPVEVIHGLRCRFTWDELDPMFDDDKWGRRRLSDAVEVRRAARAAHPLGAGERLRPAALTLGFGAAGTGPLEMESLGWIPLPGGEWDLARRQFDWTGAQRPGSLRLAVPGARKGPIFNQPPAPGLPLAAAEGEYSGAALWLAMGAGDYDARSRGSAGPRAYLDREWLRVRPGESRSILMVAQVYVPDHTEEIGEPRGGWFYIRRGSRYIDAGIRVVDAGTRSQSLLPEQALMLKVEPAMNRFDRILLRIDVHPGPGTMAPAGLIPAGAAGLIGPTGPMGPTGLLGPMGPLGPGQIRVTAFLDGVGEVARASAPLRQVTVGAATPMGPSHDGVAIAPAFGLRQAGEGYVPEFYLAGLRMQPYHSGDVEVGRRGDSP